MKKRLIKIEGQSIPIRITLEELKQSVIVSTINKTLPPKSVIKVEGKIIHNEMNKGIINTKDYLVSINSQVMDDLIVKSEIKRIRKRNNKIEEEEVVHFLITNESSRKLQLKKGDTLAFAEALSQEQNDSICSITENIVIRNIEILTSALSINSRSEKQKSATSQPAPLGHKNKENEEIHSREGGEVLQVVQREISQGEVGGRISVLKSSTAMNPTDNSNCSTGKDLEGTKDIETRAQSKNVSLGKRCNRIFLENLQEDFEAVEKGSDFLSLRDHHNWTITCDNAPKASVAIELGCSLQASEGRKTHDQGSTTSEETKKRSLHDLSGCTQPELGIIPNKGLVKWLDSTQVHPINEDGPEFQEEFDQEKTKEYIESMLINEKESKNNELISEQDIQSLVRDSITNEEERE
jgi:hypothetical protein